MRTTRFYTIIELDENHIESFQSYDESDKAKKHFKKYLRDSGLGIMQQRKHLKEEFFQDGLKQIQLIKHEVK